jgi:hypothetical protein
MNKLFRAILRLRFAFQGDRGQVRRHSPRGQREMRDTACRLIGGFVTARESGSDGLAVSLNKRGKNLFED